MNTSVIKNILLNWTGHTDLSQIETSSLEQLVKENAFSPSLQLLLAKKYELESPEKFKNQLYKTVCYFPSGLQLHQWLNKEAISDNLAPMDEKLNSMISEQLAQFNEEVSGEQLEFEKETPQIFKDYFGAQGIEIDLETIPQDKLTTQLRSFTAWLKVLKQQEQIGHNLAEIGDEQEKVVAIIAEKANKATDVLTESMAEIWEKQGNIHKAIDIYSKLSFIFPEKSVYFASRIEQLKQIKK